MKNENDDEGGESSSEEDDSTEKKNMYELLDSTASGIAEWILPLVLAANLRYVQWIRPPGTVRQIPTGEHEYHVGAWLGSAAASQIDSFLDLPLTATVKVDCDCRYYLEDDTYVPENELFLAQSLYLTVSEGTSTEALVPEQPENAFALDICLDYFACLNPFATDIEDMDVVFARALVAAVTESKLYTKQQRTETYQFELSNFRRLLTGVLESCAKADSGTVHHPSTTELLSYYETPTTATQLIEAVRASLLSHESSEERETLISMAVEAIPNLIMPHNIIEGMEGLKLDAIQDRLCCLRREIRHRCPTEPFVVTIARSTDDGFTPKSMVEELQVAVLQEIHERYCGCAAPNLQPCAESETAHLTDCRLHVIFDYGPWEGSTFV
jgi:UPF0489 domain